MDSVAGGESPPLLPYRGIPFRYVPSRPSFSRQGLTPYVPNITQGGICPLKLLNSLLYYASFRATVHG